MSSNTRHSIKDIARENGVSITTVSFVLNGKAREKKISVAVTNKILDYIKKINYRPNPIAQSLRTGKSKIIVCMVEDISNNFFSRFARMIEDLAYKKGYKVLFCSNENDDVKSVELINLFKERGVDGYIIVPSSGIEKTVKQLIDENIPVVLFDRYFPDLESSFVVVNNKESSFEATKHLIKNGFKKIGFITTDVEQTQMTDRCLGYKEALLKSDLKECVLQVSLNEMDRDGGKSKIEEFLKQNQQLDAIFFATNYLAISAIKVIKEHYPDYLINKGIISFDDIGFFDIYSPTISAISQPLKQITEKLMSIILNQLKVDGKKTHTKTILKTKLIVRESSQKRQ